MNYRALSQDCGLQLKLISYLHDQGVISDPLESGDMAFLTRLATVIGKADFCRYVLGLQKPKDRARLVLTAELNKIEQYMYSRFLMHALDPSPDKGRIYVQQVVDEATVYFHLPGENRGLFVKSGYKMRRKADYDRLNQERVVAALNPGQHAKDKAKRLAKAEAAQEVKRSLRLQQKAGGEFAPIFGY